MTIRLCMGLPFSRRPGLLPRGLRERAELLVVKLSYSRENCFSDRFPVAVQRPRAAVVVHGFQGQCLELAG